ncbi:MULTISPECIES: HlyC/CorC family transporter [unclassified Francisella]|uniref:HlyC/CorC family transporter n=1 Tax=unclassified Francisella TaxID=2610885 RepID=UPI002E2FCC8C|nr:MULTISPECIES: transporter associated domain-containing protein [unclassified Francisella]MED7819122.1 transporter associated domain-containing protein [Francisella sp. 19S2-4]MED7829918.1 transporter associated domain-containing protein [Francisella sp. 19S2-10]
MSENNLFIKRIASSIFNIKSENALIDAINKAADNEVIDKTSQNMLIGAMKISSLDVGDIMISHTKIVAVDMSMSIKEILKKTINSSHTRLPVYCEDKSEVLGILHSKDLLKLIFEKEVESSEDEELKVEDIKNILRPAIFIPETKKLNSMLKDFKNSQNHIAIVVDEYGAISGLITIEDVLEEIVGDIEDEFDTTSENIVKIASNKFVIDATTSIEDFNEYFNTSIDDDNDYDTIAGMIIQTLECLPQKGDSIVVDGLKFTIQEADNRKIIKVLIENLKNNEK